MPTQPFGHISKSVPLLIEHWRCETFGDDRSVMVTIPILFTDEADPSFAERSRRREFIQTLLAALISVLRCIFWRACRLGRWWPVSEDAVEQRHVFYFAEGYIGSRLAGP